MKVSKRLLEVPSSPIRKLIPYAYAAKKRGIKVYHLNIGDPDIKSPQVMINVLKNWQDNPIGYDQSQGNLKFIESLVWYYHKLGYKFVKPENIQVTTGGSEAISMAMFSVCNAGDEIMVFEPFYANYNSFAIVNGIKLVPIRTNIENGFHLPNQSMIEKAITSKTRAILYCSPNNPTGTVYRSDEIKMLVNIAKGHKLYLLSDEVYREYTYEGIKQTSLFDYMSEIPGQAVVLDSMSKRYSLCGVRLGNIVSLNQDLMAGVLRIAQGRLSSGFVDQAIAAELVNVPQDYFRKVNLEYQKRRNTLYEGLSKIPGVVVPKSEGAFYMIVGLPVKDSEDFCRFLLSDFHDKKETVMMAPAAGFYATPGLGKNEVRIAYVLNIPSLKHSVEILAKALIAYNKR